MKQISTKAIVKTTFTFVCLFALVFNGIAQTSLNKGLMAWYPFDGNANDNSGNGNNPSFNNAKLTTDRFGNPKSAYQFDGATSYMQIPNSASLNCGTRVTISMWVKVNGFYKGACHGNYMICKGPETNWTLNAEFSDGLYDAKNGKDACSISTPVDTAHETFYSSLGGWSDSTFIAEGKWYHLALVADSDFVSAYLDGKLIKANAKSPVQEYNSPYDLFLGRYYNASSTPYWFNGVLDDIRIYNRALNATEIDSLHNYQPKIDLNLGLMAWYPFDGNDKDKSGNHNNPTFDNAKLTTDRFGHPNSAYQFDGVTSYMQIPNSATLNCDTRATISLWVKVNGFYKGPCHGNYMLCKGPATNYNLNAVFDDGPYDGKYGKDACSIIIPDTVHQTFYSALGGWNDSTFIEKNKWYHLVLVADSNIVSAYLDDKLIKTNAKSNVQPFNTTYDLIFGRYYDVSAPYWFNGSLDDIRIYSRAISKVEVDSLYGGGTSSPLPLTIKEFTATAITSPFVSLHIGTATELNVRTIEIEKSYDGINYGYVGAIAAKGNAGVNLYNFIDKTDGIATKAFYRLRLINKDGTYTYSNIASVAVSNSLKAITAEVYPNPVHNVANINLYTIKDEALAIRVFDINGKLVYTQKSFGKKGFSVLSIPAFKSLAVGTYTVNITNSTDVVNKKVIKY